ncbi:hypothetical protein [Rhodococcus kronopolitis]|uniref:Proline rich protein n=1 Tax=Rhodococcus kronopolitis TaxID=1460226 RepID=A0ABV9FYM4_9NOCA
MSENPPPGDQSPEGFPDPNHPRQQPNPPQPNPAGGYPPPPNPAGGPQGGYPPPPNPAGGPQGGYPPPPNPAGGYPPPPNYGPQGGAPNMPGGYPPPPGYGAPGGYPPPPGGQGGYMPPPPPGYDAPAFPPPGFSGPGGMPQLTVGNALGYAWEKFKANAGVWVGIVLLIALIEIALSFIFDLNSTEFTVWGAIGTIVTTIVGYLVNAALVRGALHELDGNKPAIGSFFQFTNVGAIIVASLVVGALTGIGFLLLIIPGIVVAFLTWWTLQFVIDQQQDPITAIKSSFRAISQNVGPLVLLTLALIGINIVGALLCMVGLLVTIPITTIASTYAYRVVVGGRVTA